MTLVKGNKFKEVVAWVLMAACAVVFLSEIAFNTPSYNTERAAARLGRSIASRMAILDESMDRALAQDNDSWMDLPSLPSDMVVYKYVGDTLKFWDNQFTLNNDDISSRVLIQALYNPRAEVESPLVYATDRPVLMDMGSRWYLVKARQQGDVRVIGGLIVIDIVNGRPQNAISYRLNFKGNFIIQTLDCPGGCPVYIDGEPVMHLFHDVTETSAGSDPGMLWIALFMYLTALLLLLSGHRDMKRYIVVLAASLAAIGALYIFGRETQQERTLFSPALYAKGQVFYSLGALLLINLAGFVIILYTFVCRRMLARRYLSASGWVRRLYQILLCLTVAGIWLYVQALMRDVISNSNVTLELYKFNSLSGFTLIIYLSFLSLLLSSLLLVLMFFQTLRRGRGRHHGVAYYRWLRLAASLLASVYVVVTSAFAGHLKEASRQAVWARRLSMSRDVALELQLRTVENAIASDEVISALSGLDGTEMLILNRIAENYLPNASQDYSMRLYMLGDGRSTDDALVHLQERLQDAQSVAAGSRFSYVVTPSASTVYTGVFTYYSRERGPQHLILEVHPKSNRMDMGYASLLDMSSPGKVVLPAAYSFARYVGRNLVSYSGRYAYPTYLGDRLYEQIFFSGQETFIEDGYTHFVNRVGGETAILISRPRISAFSYFLAVLFLTILLYITLSTVSVVRRKPRRDVLSSNYYRSSASMVLVISLVVTLVVMASVSVAFVYNRNDANKKAMMAEKVTSIQAMLQQESAGAQSAEDLDTPAFANVMRMVADMSHTDVSLYTTEGKVFKSTIPEVYDRMIIGSRINQDAYDGIVYRNHRYQIQRERIGRRKYYAMYAPLFSSDGHMLAILSSPYIDENYDFEEEAVLHLVTVLAVFLILLFAARIGISTVVDRIFKPLVEMGNKMSTADIDNLEYIDYARDDEVSSLVRAYNRMVHELTQSSQKLAQAERDRAWSAMARQVAHEIKNPLTPIKLQIQRLIRLKEKNDPSWQDKFDECTRVVLDHIDILTDTANQFSTFARLYTEEPALVDLDALLKEEIAMFDNRDGIEFLYLGLDGATAMAPKPQLTRVFVNLLTNSVQAVEARRAEQADSGIEPEEGRIYVSLRNSSTCEDCYDIVFEDNGPGVSDENRDKLFTPNFTTKTGGTGLGLAICHNILDKCDATISYSRSSTLGGACFTIVYPCKRG